MTKQEEIRVEVEKHISRCLAFAGVKTTPTFAGSLSTSLMVLQDGLGVVIKVKDIQPINTYEDLTQSISEEGEYDIVVVEPLIKEVKIENN